MPSPKTSARFETQVSGFYGIFVPESIAETFYNQKIKRIILTTYFEEKEVSVHAALQKLKGQYRIMFGKRYQKELGVFTSDYFEAMIQEDRSKYGVQMPEEFQAVLDSDPEAYELFEQFTPGKQRSLIHFVLSVKNVQLRIDKALIISENIKLGITDNRELIKSQR